jgi:hypothetical protein
MVKVTASLLLAGCISLQVWAQAPQDQNSPAPAATQNSGSQDQSTQPTPDKSAANSGAQASEPPATSTEFYLDKFQEFSAIMTGSVIPGHDDPGYIYRSHNMMRMQGNHAVPDYFVTDLKKQETHGLAASGCIMLKTPYSRAFPFFLDKAEYKFQYQTAGEETVNGHPTKVVDVTIFAPKHPDITLRFYEAEDLQGFPVRIENRRKHGMPWVLDYTEVKLGPQDPSLFIVPNVCQSENTITAHGTTTHPPKAPAPAPKQ